tara:strand:- start:210 stop:626 length:417 start_codon:yes stop_codon:yes gene_type:complete
MKTIETVYNKLNSDKTELATHKVELSVASDIKKAIKALIKQEKEMDRAKAEMDKAINLLTQAKKQSESVYEKYKAGISGQLSINPFTVLKEARAIAKDLGINVSAIKDFDTLESDIGFNEDLKKKVEQDRDELEKLIK